MSNSITAGLIALVFPICATAQAMVDRPIIVRAEAEEADHEQFTERGDYTFGCTPDPPRFTASLLVSYENGGAEVVLPTEP